MYSKSLTITLKDIGIEELKQVKEIIIAGVKKRAQYNLNDINYGAVKFQIVYKDSEEEEPQTDIIEGIVVNFLQKVTINEINTIISSLKALSFIEKIIFNDLGDNKPTQVRTEDDKLLRVVISPNNPTNFNIVEALNSNPLVARVDAYPVTVVDIDFNKMDVGIIPLDFGINGSITPIVECPTTYQEQVLAVSGTNNHKFWTTLSIVDSGAYADNTKCLKMAFLPTPRFPNPGTGRWIGVNVKYGAYIKIDDVFGGYNLSKVKIEYIAKYIRPTTGHGNTFMVFRNFAHILSGGNLRLWSCESYPINNTRTLVYNSPLVNAFDWHKWEFLFDMDNSTMDISVDDNLIRQINPGSGVDISTPFRMFNIWQTLANNVVPDSNDYCLIQSIKAIAYSKLVTI